jgi:hypothetical protein
VVNLRPHPEKEHANLPTMFGLRTFFSLAWSFLLSPAGDYKKAVFEHLLTYNQ